MTRRETTDNKIRIQKQDIMQEIFNVNDSIRQMQYPELMPVYPLKYRTYLFESGRVRINQGKLGGKVEKSMKICLLEDKAYTGSYYALQIKSDVFIDDKYSLDLSETRTVSISRLLLGVFEFIKTLKLTEKGKKILNDNVLNILSQCFDVEETNSSYLTKISIKVRSSVANIGVLSESVRSLALREYNPCFLIRDCEIFKKALISLLNCLMEKRCVSTI